MRGKILLLVMVIICSGCGKKEKKFLVLDPATNNYYNGFYFSSPQQLVGRSSVIRLSGSEEYTLNYIKEYGLTLDGSSEGFDQTDEYGKFKYNKPLTEGTHTIDLGPKWRYAGKYATQQGRVTSNISFQTANHILYLKFYEKPLAPSNFKIANHNTSTGEITLSWDKLPYSDIICYILYITSDYGGDLTIDMPDGSKKQMGAFTILPGNQTSYVHKLYATSSPMKTISNHLVSQYSITYGYAICATRGNLNFSNSSINTIPSIYTIEITLGIDGEVSLPAFVTIF